MAGTVTVACKLPRGLVLQLFSAVSVEESVAGGGSRTVTRFTPNADKPPVTLNGVAFYPQNGAPESAFNFALTHNVDKDFWDAWVEQTGKYLAAYRNKLIFAHEKAVNTTAEAKAEEGRRSGLERIDPKKLLPGLEAGKREAA